MSLLAATNRHDVLDSALLRPGMFDRQVTVDRFDVVKILQVHSRGKVLAKDVDFDKIARRTSGFTVAYLQKLMNEAAKIIAAKRTKTLLSHYYLILAVDMSLILVQVIHPSVNVLPIGYSGQSHGRTSYSSNDLPKAVVMILDLMSSSYQQYGLSPHTSCFTSHVSGESERKLKSESRNDDSKKSVIKIGNTKVRTVSSQRPGLANQDSQIGSLDSGRRTLAAKKRSTGEETSYPTRVKKISGPSSDTRSSSSGPRHSRILTLCSGSSSVRTRRPVNVHGNTLSPVQSTCVTPDNVDAIVNVLLALERIDQDEGLTFENSCNEDPSSEKKLKTMVIDLNNTRVSPLTDGNNSLVSPLTKTNHYELSSLGACNGQRQSTRNRPLTKKALEALANGF
ncbi:ATPase [Artemisia annua]|uniref:ATPase n=1 Tax=Artemisia annua TaxID=35608 RepID=A0A2U1KT72_ARTAN|nr:ATPase [Artemisia annua]